MTCTDKECCYHGQPKASSCECANDKPQKRANIPAFPCEWDYIGSNREAANGMTLRDWFAGKALAGLAAHNFTVGADNEPFAEWASAYAYELADAMLKVRGE